ncbi:MAG: heavy metal translocating P-type ATPase [Duganella sp.]
MTTPPDRTAPPAPATARDTPPPPARQATRTTPATGDDTAASASAFVSLARPRAAAPPDPGCCAAPGAPVAHEQPRPSPAGTRSLRYRIVNMDCPVEERLIRGKVAPMAGVARLDFDLMGRILTVHRTVAGAADIEAALAAIGMRAERLGDDASGDLPADDAPRLTRRQAALLGIAGAAAVAAEVLAWTTHTDGAPAVVALAVLSIAAGGLPTLKKGWIALRNLALNIHFLMSLAVAGAVAVGQWPEAAMVVFLFAVAELIESLALDRARNAVQGLLKLAPDTATVRGADGAWQDRPAGAVAVGDVLLVRPGDRIALDGVVRAGASAVDQAPITGESVPVDKAAGDTVFAGTINGRGVLEVEATSDSRHSTLARIVRIVGETQANRAPTQRFVDVFAQYYTPLVVVMAVLVAVVPALFFGAALAPWLYKALVLLVIACPCALVVSTPVAIVSGLTAATRLGLLVKGGQFLESGYRLRAVALDKTGTLTCGHPTVTQVHPFGGASSAQVLLLAASLDAQSTHPLAAAIVRAGPPAGAHPAVPHIQALPGRGARGAIDGAVYHLGNQRLMQELGAWSPAIEAVARRLEDQGHTVVVLAKGMAVLGALAIADPIRPGALHAIGRLQALGVATVMLTGDNARAAARVGGALGIDNVVAQLLPEDKLGALRQLQARYGAVGMVGDGINDAPALAQADIGFAMGAAGSDAAIETADVALMDDDLGKLPVFIAVSRATRRILVQNIAAALAIKAVFFGLALAGLATLWMAVFADVGASLLVVFNGLRLLRRRF